MPLEEVTIENLQHADGWAALQNGAVDAWAGLDPIMANAEATAGAKLLYRNVGFNSYGFLNATEAFINEQPDVAQTVVDAYEKARAWALANPEATAALLAEVAGIDPAVAAKVITERTNLGVDNVPGEAQLAVLGIIGPDLRGLRRRGQPGRIDAALATLINPTFATAADPRTGPRDGTHPQESVHGGLGAAESVFIDAAIRQPKVERTPRSPRGAPCASSSRRPCRWGSWWPGS